MMMMMEPQRTQPERKRRQPRQKPRQRARRGWSQGLGGWAVMLLALAGVTGTGRGQTIDEDEAMELPGNVETFVVRTTSPLNRQAPFYLRVPEGFKAGGSGGRKHRLLVMCPHLNGSGKVLITGPEVAMLAKQHPDWFVVAPTFRVEGADTQDRKAAYYYPESFSGKAVLDALELMAKKYPIDTERLLLNGTSGGAQFVHRFAIWAPERVTAVCVNASSWFDEPTEECRRVAWFVSIGEADPSYDKTLEFVDALRRIGAYPILQESKGEGHGRSREASAMVRLFLGFYDALTAGDLGKPRTRLGDQSPKVPLEKERMAMVGDSQDFKAFPNTPENEEAIAEDARVYLPTREMAEVWARGDGE